MEELRVDRRSWVFRHRKGLVFGLSIALALYVSAYFWISRTRWAEYKQWDMPGFYYLPSSYLDKPEKSGWRLHRILASFYYPMNVVDVHLFDGPHCAGEPLQGIGPRKPK